MATALQLIALSARQNPHSAHKSARRLAGINASHLSDYLVDEVLDNVDLATRHFLLKRHFALNERCPHHPCDRRRNGQMRLEEIERQGRLQRMDDTASGSAITRCLVTPPALPVGTGGGAAGNPPCRRRKLDGPGISQRSDSSCAGGRRCADAARYSA
ncbi:hypothetical protein ACNKHV_21470 [Shigella flexneri]